MSIPVENLTASRYEDNNFNGKSVVAAAINIIKGDYDAFNGGGNAQGGDSSNPYRRFYGALPEMFESRGIDILQDEGLSIRQMVAMGLLDEDILIKLNPYYRSEYIIYQGSGRSEFAYHKDYPVVPGSSGLALKEQRRVVDDHCKAIMDNHTGIFPGIHNLRDTLAFVLAFNSAQGRYPIREGNAIRTFDLLRIEGEVEYHPTVWLYGNGLAANKLTIEITGADTTDSGTGAALFWMPSQ